MFILFCCLDNRYLLFVTWELATTDFLKFSSNVTILVLKYVSVPLRGSWLTVESTDLCINVRITHSYKLILAVVSNACKFSTIAENSFDFLNFNALFSSGGATSYGWATAAALASLSTLFTLVFTLF